MDVREESGSFFHRCRLWEALLPYQLWIQKFVAAGQERQMLCAWTQVIVYFHPIEHYGTTLYIGDARHDRKRTFDDAFCQIDLFRGNNNEYNQLL